MAATTTLTLTEFLLARIAEDEDAAKATEDGYPCYDCAGYSSGAVIEFDHTRVLAECQAKRRIVEHHERNPLSEEVGPEWADLCRVCTDAHEPEEWPCITLRAIALPYADHPDYRDEWKP